MNNKRVLTILLIIAVAYGLFTYWPNIQKAFYRAPVKKIVTPSPASAGAPVSPETMVPTKEVTESAAKFVDPFARRIEVRSKAEDAQIAADAAKYQSGERPIGPVLEGIWVDSGRRVAFISGQTLMVGGEIMGWQVTSILSDRVVLEKDSETKTLKMEAK
jgi:hypothetical protein